MATTMPDYAPRWPSATANETEKTQDMMEQSRFTSVNGYLYTPPEHTADSFSQDLTQPSPTKYAATRLAPLQPHTPPTSPGDKPLPSIGHATGFSPSDEPLFPARTADRARSQSPLFEADRSPSIPRAVSVPSGEEVGQDLSKLTLGRPAPVHPPIVATEDTASELLDAFLGVKNGPQALAYYWSRMGEFYDIRAACKELPRPNQTRSSGRDAHTRQQINRLNSKAGVTKPRLQQKPAPKHIPASPSVSSVRTQRPSESRRRSSKAKTPSKAHDSASPDAQEKKHKRAPPSKKIEDTRHWSEIPDRAPPTNTLDTSGKTMKVSWPGSPLDLSADPDRNELHPQELYVAGALRLPCAAYLFNKRKIFLARVQSLKDGKNFTKTAAQVACQIDVNKASQLWEAFSKVGWFEAGYFQQYL